MWKVKPLDGVITMQAQYRTFSFTAHYHEDYAIGLIEDGVQRFNCQGTDFAVPTHSLFTVNPGDVHDGRSALSNGYRYSTIFIPPELLSPFVSSSVQVRFNSPLNEDLQASRLVQKLFVSLRSSHPEEIVIQERFHEMLDYLMTTHTNQTPDSLPHYSHPAISRGCDFINDMATETISLDDIATAVGLSPYHFLRLFKKQTGLSPHGYLLNRRLHLARAAIEQGSPLADAAIDAGFFDQSHFSKHFKAAFGLTPGKFKNAISPSSG